jgi:hypothetical protein
LDKQNEKHDATFNIIFVKILEETKESQSNMSFLSGAFPQLLMLPINEIFNFTH